MQYVVIQTEPNKRRIVFGPFGLKADARAYAQTLSDANKENGSGYRYSIDEIHTPNW